MRVASDLRFERLLACLGGSPWLESQVETVAALVRALAAEATVLHVASPGVDPAPVRERVSRALAAAGLAAEVATVTDPAPDRAILREVDRRRADLLYAGAAPHESLVTDLVGSTARRIARSARCSVLLDAAPVGRGGTFRLAVVSVTFDEASRRTARAVLALRAQGVIRDVHLVHEALPAPASAVRSDSAQAHTLLRARADAALRDFVAGLGDEARGARVRVVEGRDHTGLLDHARQVAADLVVCRGPRARRFTFWRWFGSEHEALLTDLPPALLLVRPEAAPRPWSWTRTR